MIWLRAIVYYVLLALTVLYSSLAIVLLNKFATVRHIDKVVRQWSQINIWLQKVICGLHVNVEGEAYLSTTPCIFLVKHQSAWETISLHHYLPQKQGWVLKQELLNIPVLGWALKMAHFIPIDRTAGRRAIIQLIRTGTDYLQDGRSVLLFPEGTRTAPGERQKYNIGGALLAQKTGFPVIPIAHNAGVHWARQGLKKYPGTIQVRIGPPIHSVGKTAAEIMEETETWIEDTVRGLPTQR